MSYVDFHTHILPSMDDGAVDIDTSLKMIQKLQEQSVRTVVLTPHYYSHKEPLDKFLNRREKAVAQLQEAMGESSLLQLRVGAEVYFSEYLFNNKDLSALCIDGTKTMLVELPFRCELDKRLLSQIERLYYEHTVIPVLAHIDRYPMILKSTKLRETLLEIGCVFHRKIRNFH